MNKSTVIEQDVQVQIPLLFKVNKEKREVEGIATQEVTDVHGEIVDHESMKSVLADWPGNIREMHQPIAVGKALKVESDDEAKATIVRARISKGAEDTWLKVLDGTLSMYSIGGTGKRITTKSADGSEEKRIVMSALHEISLVDNGACPTAKFQIVKSVDGQSIECQPEEPVRLGRAGMLALLAKKVAIAPPAGDAVVKASYPEVYDINAALQAIACLESLLASEWWEARDEAASGETDDAGTAQAQLQLLRQAINLVLAFLVSEFDEQFSEFDEADAAAAVADPMAFAAGILKRGARHSKADISMIQAMHDSAVTLGAGCASTEKQAVAKTLETPAAPAIAETPAELQARAAAAHAATLAKATPVPVPAVEPVAVVIDPSPAPVPAAEPAPVQAAVVSTVDVQSIVKAAVAEAIAAHQATSDQTIAELRTQVDKLSAQPRPGGPVARVVPVQKALAGDPAVATDQMNPAEVQAFAEGLAKDAKSEDERMRIVQNLIRFQQANGVGAVAFRSTTGRSTDPQPDGK